MVKINILSIILSIVFCSHICSQTIGVKPEDAKLANQLKAKYKGKDLGVVALHSKDEVSFSLATSKALSSPVLAEKNTISNFISVKDNYYYEDAIFYNVQSEITNLWAKSPRGMPIIVSPTNKTYQENGIFYSDAKVCEYGFPFETKGTRINLSYTERYYDVKYLTSVFFHDRFPMEEKIISFTVPDWLNVELKEMNFSGFGIEKSVAEDAKKKTKTYTYTAKDLRAYKSEQDAPNISHNYPHILVLCKSYKTKDGSENKLFESVKDLYAWYSSLTKMVKNDPADLKPIVERITASKNTDSEKIEAIYYWVQDNIRYIAFENGIMGFKPEAAQNVYKNKYGYCKGMANLTKEMLKVAGYDARLTWIGTRDIPYDYSTPSLCVDNHMICTVILNGKKYFLDATVDYLALNDYEHAIQGRQVLIEDGDNYILDNIPEFGIERNKLENSTSLVLDKDVLKGQFKSISNGEEKIMVLNGLASIGSDDKQNALRKYVSGGNSNVQVSNITTSNLEERQKPLEINYNFELTNHVTSANEKEIYIIIDKDNEYSSSEIDTSERVNDYEMSHKICIVSKTEFTVPVGFRIESMPDQVEKKYPDFSFSLKYELVKNKIIYTKKITIDNAIIRKKDFALWNGCIKAIRNFYKDPIQLSKN